MHHVGVADSYARRSAGHVFVQLHVRDVGEAHHGGSMTLQLVSLGKAPKRRVEVEADVAPAARGAILRAQLPRADVEPGRWQVRIRESAGEDFRRAPARLLVSPDQPVALLVGPAPATRMPPPKARRRGGAGRPAMARRRLRRLARGARQRFSGLR